MVIGANINSYLRRGAEFDVMRNVEAGVEDAGEVATATATHASVVCDSVQVTASVL
jgi:hypothetical protein